MNVSHEVPRCSAGLLCACSVPLVFNLQFGRRACGPHQGISMLLALGNAVSRAPRYVETPQLPMASILWKEDDAHMQGALHYCSCSSY